ncbi:chromosome segregation protein Csm1/Pcs1-domain-containing protein [Xylaria bambusicola]|uniref:chromosome segregation protein Csm1/Pcs1-domain-containing protein n=1 Tax=Xylaria bambusicola TaxID=326684 RepID=UPI0020077E65|nr:chromosome segregation protein Csm1/Pcs1-domain-containing protein [Xylaria bambusicola]KAI0506220.1 chromosome segregation protein Csm1/Pcs1-domain-containing protein [Xylaria bambusicola]
MPRGKLTTLLELDLEQDLDLFTHQTQPLTKTMPPAKRGRAAATGRVAKSTRVPRASARNALAEKAGNIQEDSTESRGIKRPASDAIDAPEDQDTEAKPRPGRGRPRVTKARRLAEAEEEDELSVMESETTPPQPVRRGRKPKINVEAEKAEVAEIPETQPEIEIPETQQVDIADTDIVEDDPIEVVPFRYLSQGISSVQRPQSKTLFTASRRPVSASDSELNDPSLRRRIGELTRKNEALEAKYRDLREIGVQEAERNFDRLRKQSEERANTDKELIATLKAQLAGETEVAKEVEQLRKQLEDSQKKVEELQGSLTEAKAEIKTLSTKLTAARSAEPANVKIPGSAMKNNFANNRHAINAAEAAAQVAQKKENLYGDLTGLLVCGVKRENDEEVFDCVQTGRNGTLHFKLSIALDGSSDKFEDAQFMYMPQLDGARDQELIDTLPDYLVEEITFPRLHAAKFYSRVVKALNDRPE